jgi:hypothetical protein
MVFSGGDWSLCDEEGVTGHGKEVVAAGLSFFFFPKLQFCGSFVSTYKESL